MTRPLSLILGLLLATSCLDEGLVARGDDGGVPDDTDPVDTDPTDGGDDASDLGGFGDPCEVDEDCESGLCWEFGQLGLVCSIPCEEDADCPEGSQGQKCNSEGVCRP